MTDHSFPVICICGFLNLWVASDAIPEPIEQRTVNLHPFRTKLAMSSFGHLVVAMPHVLFKLVLSGRTAWLIRDFTWERELLVVVVFLLEILNVPKEVEQLEFHLRFGTVNLPERWTLQLIDEIMPPRAAPLNLNELRW